MHEGKAWPPRLFAMTYAAGALLMFGYALWHYLMGDFARILLPAVMALLLACATVLRLVGHRYKRMAAYLVLISCYLVLGVELSQATQSATLWLGLPPLLSLLLLPLGPALLINLILTPFWLLLPANVEVSSNETFAYLSILILGMLAPLEQYRQRSLLDATDPLDRECQALNDEAIHEQLDSEFARASLLQRRLSVLVIHLPQLEMAHEQFGTRLRRELLQQFSHSAQQTCRVNDSLGRVKTSLFWLVLTDTGETGALMVRHRLLTALGSTVLSETGPIASRIAVCSPHREETWSSFEQRLQIKGHALMESTH
ncbi:diguanylate cyclase domain-containing protein [Litchfieldella xinjiangensis]|uniref:diguanylate cyclase domain-containing protein n=1 Tax=Litchfieldella xinjiangensis TaxID=1166948 RepID=UPI0005BBC696|nr:diguanylate cyclase [Halomonas xinjiangensis]